jgi:hypothetical protein
MKEIVVHDTGAKPWMLFAGFFAAVFFFIGMMYWGDIRSHQYSGEGLPLVSILMALVCVKIALSLRNVYWNLETKELSLSYPLFPILAERRFTLGPSVNVVFSKASAPTSVLPFQVRLLGRKTITLGFANEAAAKKTETDIRQLLSTAGSNGKPATGTPARVRPDIRPELSDYVLGLFSLISCYGLLHLDDDVLIITRLHLPNPQARFFLLGLGVAVQLGGTVLLYLGTVRASAVLRQSFTMTLSRIEYLRAGGWRLLLGTFIAFVGAFLQGAAKT